MSEPDFDTLRRIDEICERFEDALRDGGRPVIDEFLKGDWDAVARAELVRRLMTLEVDHARVLGALCRSETYLARWPEHADVITGVFAAVAAERIGEPVPEAGEVGRYQLIERLGEGGMGTVWRAEQREPVRREVALKVVKLGMDTREVIARFEAERQALALMDHPNIARVLDAGSTDAGRPYFVMELVLGTPITTWCDRERLGLRERLSLVIDVCRALQHAHQKGVIHRDIKPSNVLVTDRDGVPTPKVIDFGLAKATGAGLVPDALLTGVGQMIGTPAYMAPEQTGLSARDVDTRADVYAVGVLLYELLTGTLPFDTRRAMEMGFDELVRVIREDDPPRPSSRVSSVTVTVDEGDDGATFDLEAYCRDLRDDLDWIVLKAIEKDRERRYETVSALAADLRCYLAAEPVSAAPPSTLYRATRFVRRRRRLVSAAAAIAVVALVGVAGTGVGYWRTLRANRSLGVALAETGESLREQQRLRGLAEESRDRVLRAEEQERRRAVELETAAEFQSALLDAIDVEDLGARLRRLTIDAATEDRRADVGRRLADLDMTAIARDLLRDVLFDETADAIDARFADRPEVRARLLESLADTLERMGLDEAAAAARSRAR